MGVPMASAEQEAKRGFGRELIERALPYDLGAETSFRFADDGVRCELRIPLEDGALEPADGEAKPGG